MQFLKYSFATILAVVVLLVTGLIVATAGVPSQPGYAKTSLPGWSSGDVRISFNIGPLGMKPIRWVAQRAIDSSEHTLNMHEEVLMGILHDVEGVQLKVLDASGDASDYDAKIAASVADLKQQGWEVLVSAREDTERAVILQQTKENVIEGLAILARDNDSVVFINLVGQFDPAEIMAHATQLTNQ